MTGNPNDAFDMLKPSKAKILRVEISNPGLPGNLTELTTSRPLPNSSSKRNRLVLRRVFDESHDRATRRMLGKSEDEKFTFGEYVDRYSKLKYKYVRNVLGFGNFIRDQDVHSFVAEAEAFNIELRKLCLKVRAFLRDNLHLFWNDILLFNPRVKYSLFILTAAYVRDESFIREVKHMRIPFDGNPGVQELLGDEISSFDDMALLRQKAIDGDVSAQFKLGMRYARGEGVEKNVVEGTMWINRAAQHGCVEAERVLNRWWGD